ncbi:hypothetical protein Bhyg_14152 [Pseudolycoriella hygida]|uniref:Uncharacterized protein n=1 Tax=Pseudolycoriella hygida TaxID=35572 RepID=A0A9Q0MPP2_9DIPT|nr:hypothetical protein Bhyg_14152 [Pseudolycoriella hygida]
MMVTRENNLDTKTYLRQIKKLRRSFVSFDIDTLDTNATNRLNAAYEKLALQFDGVCYRTVPTDIELRKSGLRPNHFRIHMYEELLTSYKSAAVRCSEPVSESKNLTICQRHWAIANCVMNGQLEDSYDGPFYPVNTNVPTPFYPINMTILADVHKFRTEAEFKSSDRYKSGFTNYGGPNGTNSTEAEFESSGRNESSITNYGGPNRTTSTEAELESSGCNTAISYAGPNRSNSTEAEFESSGRNESSYEDDIIHYVVNFNTYTQADFESHLNEHYNEQSRTIRAVWNKCSENFPGVQNLDKIYLFQKANYSTKLFANEDVKCFISCMMRELGVVTRENNLDTKTYLRQIKKLRRSFVSFDIDTLDTNATNRLNAAYEKLALQFDGIPYAGPNRSNSTEAEFESSGRNESSITNYSGPNRTNSTEAEFESSGRQRPPNIVTPENNLDMRTYLRQIKKLRRSFVSFDIDTLDENATDRLRNAYEKLALQFDGVCYRTVPADIDLRKIELRLNLFRIHMCEVLLTSYEDAADRCSEPISESKNLTICQRHWAIANCVMNRQLEDSYDGPFYPISYAGPNRSNSTEAEFESSGRNESSSYEDDIIHYIINFNTYTQADFESHLNEHYDEQSRTIRVVWNKCSENFPGVHNLDKIYLFQKANYSTKLFANEDVKCFISCMMRELGVVTRENNLDTKTYLRQIKKLRRSFVSFDIDTLDTNATNRLNAAYEKLALQFDVVNGTGPLQIV